MRSILIAICVWCVIVQASNINGEDQFVVRRGERRVLVSTENGEIVAARVGGASFLLHFFTMEPNSLFLPVILHSDMFFYVHTGSGKLLWTDENELKTADLRRGDVYRLKAGAAFFIQSNLETETQRQKLRIHSIFPNSNTDMLEPPTGPYSSIRDMVLGFDKKVLQAAFKVPEEVIEELLNGTKPPAIIHGVSKSERRAWEMETKLLGSLLSHNIFELSKKKGKKLSSKLFNLFKEDKDFENSNGWSTTVTGKKLSALKGTNIGLFMVNLTTGSMMGPHWNPAATEIAIVVQGRGMVRVVCPSVSNGTGCSDMMRFEVEEGDLFVVPRFHPMAQMAFNNETFVFMGFSSSAKKNHPQFLAGQASVLRTLSKDMLATSFGVDITTMDRLLASQQDSVILRCVSCADEEFRILEEERERERKEAREREEEEERKREEEAREREAREREEERQREEEEAKRQEEERKRREEEEEREEERRREEEEAKRQEEERKRREEEAREREEEEAKRQEEERKRRQEEEERRREEEETREKEEEEAEERKRREKEEEREEEAARKKREEEEKAARREEEEEEERKREEEAARREEEEEEERRRQRAATKRREEEERQRQEEEEEEIARREEEERQRREEEEEEEEEERRRRGEEEERWSEEEEAAEEERRREEEEERRHQVE